MVKAVSISTTQSKPPSVTQLIRAHRRIDHLCRGSLPKRVISTFSNRSIEIGFQILRTPAKNAAEIFAKLDFAFRDMDQGEVGGIADAARAGIRADLKRLGGWHD